MLDRAGAVLRQLKGGLNRRFAQFSRDPLTAQLYRGYRSESRLFLQGRVLEDERIEVAETDRRWRNFVNAIRRFESDEVAGARVRVEAGGEVFDATTDAEGYFEIHEPLGADERAGLWQPTRARIVDTPSGRASAETFAGEYANLRASAEYAIVTDIDDTILRTYVTSLFKLRALYHTLVDNAHTRVTFDGAVELFEQLSRGTGAGHDRNPVFYLSRSPWNLYDMLENFLDVKGFPKGPIFLRDVGLPYENTPTERGHKAGTLYRLIEDFPGLRFILVGDSGERDADIYREVATSHPERVAAIVIRNVKNNANARRIARMFARPRPAGQHWFLVADSAEAAHRLCEVGLLDEAQRAAVTREETPEEAGDGAAVAA